MAGTDGPFGMIFRIFIRVRGAVGAALRAARPAWQVTSPAGRGVLLVAVAAWLLGVRWTGKSCSWSRRAA
jgi:hypothetical protein